MKKYLLGCLLFFISTVRSRKLFENFRALQQSKSVLSALQKRLCASTSGETNQGLEFSGGGEKLAETFTGDFGPCFDHRLWTFAWIRWKN